MCDTDIEKWRLKRMIKSLNSASGNGTSMISLIIPAGSDLPTWTKKLVGEISSCVNIKSRVNRQSVQSAIESVHARVSQRKLVPPNGLCIFVGNVIDPITHKERKVAYDFEPPRPINTSLYRCDKTFHAEALGDLIDEERKYGFIIVDGNGVLFATLQGAAKDVLYKYSVELPKKHNKGGQSSVRFGRLRDEACQRYIRKVGELATQQLIRNDKCIVDGIIVAGCADYKHKILEDQFFDPRLKAKIIDIIDVAYGGENGFNQAIEMTQSTLANVKFVQEKKVISSFMNHIALDAIDATKWCFGHKDTFAALEAGAVETLIVYEDLQMMRYTLAVTDEVIIAPPPRDGESLNFEYKDSMVLVEWLAENFSRYGTTLELISNKTAEGEQFIKGFGGIGGILRYPMSFETFDEEEVASDEFSDDW
jgi:peptide chain release factor subunit 1